MTCVRSSLRQVKGRMRNEARRAFRTTWRVAWGHHDRASRGEGGPPIRRPHYLICGDGSRVFATAWLRIVNHVVKLCKGLGRRLNFLRMECVCTCKFQANARGPRCEPSVRMCCMRCGKCARPPCSRWPQGSARVTAMFSLIYNHAEFPPMPHPRHCVQ